MMTGCILRGVYLVDDKFDERFDLHFLLKLEQMKLPLLTREPEFISLSTQIALALIRGIEY